MEKQWFYTVNKSDRQGPVSQEDLLAMIREGRVQGSDLAWSSDMADWQPVARIAELSGVIAGAAAAAPLATASGATAPAGPAGLPDGLLGWMNFVGIVTVISGILNLCTFLLGIFLIIAGLALLGARTALMEMPRIDPAMGPFMEKLRSFMKMMGIFYIVYAVIMIIGVIAYIVIFATMISAAGMSGM